MPQDGEDKVAKRPNGAAGVWALYLNALKTNPIRTKALSSALFSVFSDLISQRLRGEKSLNVRSLVNQFIIGALLRGTVIHFWHTILEAHVKGPSAMWKKLALDQTVFAPSFNCLYMYTAGLLEGRSLSASTAMVQNTLWTIVKNNWRVWPAAMLLSFYAIPPHLRVLWGNLVGLFWNVYVVTATSKTK
mmetsp:Transcript_22999/g.53747  ORF Transcript_22999/g.53747 Transcript_22999/m.53747 type:complete len:189 (-) Transcript_22999:100-666(-)